MDEHIWHDCLLCPCNSIHMVCASGCVVECRVCNRGVEGSNLGLGYFAPRSAQPSIPPGSAFTTSAKEVVFSSALGSLFVCQQDYEKLRNRFSQNSVERRHMSCGRNHKMLVVISCIALYQVGSVLRLGWSNTILTRALVAVW